MNGTVGLFEVLTALATGVGIGAVVAFLLERIAWFQNMEPKIKTWVVLAICVVLPYLGWFGLRLLSYAAWPVGAQAWGENMFYEIEVGFLTWAASQGWHLVEKSVRKAAPVVYVEVEKAAGSGGDVNVTTTGTVVQPE